MLRTYSDKRSDGRERGEGLDKREQTQRALFVKEKD